MNIPKLSAVRKVPETIVFQALGIIETLGSIISHGTSSKFADVRTHLRKVSKMIFLNLNPDLAIWVFLFLKVLFAFFDDDRGEGQEGNQVRQSHQPINNIRNHPDQIQLKEAS